MKLRPNPPVVVIDRDALSRMIDGILRTVDRVMDRPRRKTAKRTPADERELVSKSA